MKMTARTATIVGNNIGKLANRENVRAVKSILLETAATVDAGDTIAVELANYGITRVLGMESWKHTTDNSVCVRGTAATTALATGTFTITVPTGSDNDKRLYEVFYE